jgi:hypothetical protein
VTSDRSDRNVGVAGCEACQVIGVVRENHAASEANCGRDDECVDGELAASARIGEEVPGDSSGSRPRGHDVRETTRQNRVDRSVSAATPIQLDEHCRRNSHREVPLVRTAEGGAHELVTLRGLARACEYRQRLAVEN